MDAWEAARFTPAGDPGPQWRRTMGAARDALAAALAAAGAGGQRRRFVLRCTG
jgi:hypothetical protein